MNDIYDTLHETTEIFSEIGHFACNLSDSGRDIRRHAAPQQASRE